MFSVKHGIHRADYTAKCTIDGEHVQMVDMKITLPKPKKPDPPAYLRKPNRIRKRGIIRAALGKRACGWQYRVELDNWPRAHVGDIRKGLVWFDRFWELHREGLSICNAAKQTNEEFAEATWAREDAAAAMQEPTVPWAQVKRELGLGEAAPATGGQSAASCGAKEIDMSKQEALEAIDGALVFVSDEVGEEVGDDASQVYRSLADVKAFIEALPE